MVGVQINVPLYTGGWRSAKQDEALALQAKAEAQVQSTREQVAQQVHGAWLGLGRRQPGAALGEALTASEARLDATRLGHEVGHRTLLDVLSAENDAAAARLAWHRRAPVCCSTICAWPRWPGSSMNTLRSANQTLTRAP